MYVSMMIKNVESRPGDNEVLCNISIRNIKKGEFETLGDNFQFHVSV